MLIIKNSTAKKLINWLLTLSLFNKHFAVLTWDKAYIIRRDKTVEQLLKIEITENNILELKFKYHSSHNVLKEHVAEIDSLNYENRKLHLTIWTNEQKTHLIKQTILPLTEQTNETLHKLLNVKVFNEKYGDNYSYFITLYLQPEILKMGKDDRQFAEITLKYSLKNNSKISEMRHKTKFNISKGEARKLSSSISYWKI